MKAVIDRIEDKKHAVLILNGDGEETVIPVDDLPDGAEEGTWLEVKFDGDDIKSIEIDEEATEERSERIGNKMDQLKKRKKK